MYRARFRVHEMVAIYDFLAKKEFLQFVNDLYTEVNWEALKGEFSEGAELVKILSEKFDRLEGIEL